MPHTAIHTAAWLISPHAPPLAGGALVVRDGLIVAAGSRAEVTASHSSPVIDHPGCAILPGFVNAHTHLELTHFPAWRLRNHVEYHPRHFVDWIIQLIKVKRGLTIDDMLASAREGVRMCLESGTTAVGEIVSTQGLTDYYGSSGVSGRLYFELLGHDKVRFRTALTQAVTAVQSIPEEAFATGLSPHAPYTLADENLPLISEAAKTAGLPLAIHLSESVEETAFIFDSSGPLAEQLYPFVGWERYLTPPRRCSSTELLDRAGLLTPNTLAVHCVHVTRADAEILKRRGVSVALCPRSNERLAVGWAPVALLRKLGIPLALGTDSLASNDSLSLWDELRFALDAFPGELSPADVLHMVTLGGAAALGIDKGHGTLEPGKCANFQIVGNLGDGGETGKLLERVVFEGVVQDVFVQGQQYVGTYHACSDFGNKGVPDRRTGTNRGD
ncbi:MAG: amidohydrolase family protein [Verrucomicrobia bacterium]|nr:amidohydrolase family protein [Deltaproteobacteria bacterium]